MDEKWTAERLYKLLKEKFELPAYIVLPQVANGTGWSRERRYADALVMSLWPSRGLHLHGIEVKVSKSDWRAELRNPRKSEAVQSYCDRWWIVAPPGVVDLEDLPPTWGLLEPEKKRKLLLRTKKQAPELSPKPMDRKFFAAILRRVAEHETDDAKIAKAVRQATEKAFADAAKVEDAIRVRIEKEHNELRTRVAEFEKASGIGLSYRYDGSPSELGEAVRTVLVGSNRYRLQLKHMRDTAARIVADCDNGLAVRKNPRALSG